MGVESSVRDDTQMKEQRRDRIISISTNIATQISVWFKGVMN